MLQYTAFCAAAPTSSIQHTMGFNMFCCYLCCGWLEVPKEVEEKKSESIGFVTPTVDEVFSREQERTSFFDNKICGASFENIMPHDGKAKNRRNVLGKTFSTSVAKIKCVLLIHYLLKRCTPTLYVPSRGQPGTLLCQ